MARLEDRQFIVNGKPTLVLAGEVHYFRLKRAEWEDRIRKAKEAGCNCIASYIPWLWHEERSGEADVVGRTRPERDLGSFIDLCRREGLWFIARPGPYVMAEVKNEGLPYWVFEECPDALTVNWNGSAAKSRVVRYNDAAFLRRVERWYGAVMPILAQRLEPTGGNVIAVQLDNEIGMLQCWSEDPDLSDDTLCEFARFIQSRGRSADYPFDLGDPQMRAKMLRDPNQPSALRFWNDYHEFIRGEFARYVATLRRFAEQGGVRGVPFLVNIHGSGGGRATTFPIGIAQVYESYAQEGQFWGSSDHYLGDITRENAGDLYMLNAFMACTNLPNQPLSSVEFEAGTGDYGETGGNRYTGKATDFKARVSVIQGNRLLNHYLIAGGHNPLLDDPPKDGNGRLGTTGGRHGFAAPIGPEGQLDPVYFDLKDTNGVLAANADILATGQEEWDDIALGFIPSAYQTDIKPAGPMRDLALSLESARGWQDRIIRAMWQCGLGFPAVNLESDARIEQQALVVATSPHMNRTVAERIIAFAEGGGRAILFGAIPQLDLLGNSGLPIAGRLGVTLGEPARGSVDFFPSMRGFGPAEEMAEARFYEGFPFRCANAEPIFRMVQSPDLLGAKIRVGEGSVTLLTVQPPQNLAFWQKFFAWHGVKPAIGHDDLSGGLLLGRVRSNQGDLVSLVNLDDHSKEIRLQGNFIRPDMGAVYLAGRTAKLLPSNVVIGRGRIIWSTAEIVRRAGTEVWFRRGTLPERLAIAGSVVETGEGIQTTKLGDHWVCQVLPGTEPARIRFAG